MTEMKTYPKLLISAAVFAGSLSVVGAAFAQEATPDTWMNGPFTKTRAEVKAELAKARADGQINDWRRGYIPAVHSTLTRAEVRAETRAALADGEVHAINAGTYNAPLKPAMQVASN
jgi:hypothetical protein